MYRAAYGPRLASSFYLKDPPTLVTRLTDKVHMAATELWHLKPDFGFTTPIAGESAYLIGLQLMNVERHELWLDGRSVAVKPIAAGTTHIYDLRSNPVAWLPEPFHPLFFYVPCKALTQLAESLGMPAAAELQHRPGDFVDDPVINHLGQCLLPALHAERRNQQLFVDHVLLALRTHLLSRCTGNARKPPVPCGGLAPWQQRNAIELMREHLPEGIALEEVARACALSTSTFIRLFHASTGVSPHQWMIQQRIERAIELMRDDPTRSLADIAYAAGFADQSHFTRTFSRKMGMTPSMWRSSLQTPRKPTRH
ncbi:MULTISPECIES: AraC family transcriptional regulator [unclassified Rhodanobacter]|uniref:Helix-turn-helix domain-containing protein n=1 Tax=Rhodanobacter humi TaxID=1888173 RepID=A0ABV4AXD7_9GAMM